MVESKAGPLPCMNFSHGHSQLHKAYSAKMENSLMIDEQKMTDQETDFAAANPEAVIAVPRIWTAICVPLLAIFAATILSSIALVSAMSAKGIAMDPQTIADATQDILATPIGIWIAVIPGQSVFLWAALMAAFVSPVQTTKRLQLSKCSTPVWKWFVFAIATPGVGIAAGMLAEFCGIEMSAQLETMRQMMGGRSGIQLLIAAVLIGVVPGVVEEMLFRGYLQSRLLQRWHPVAAILVSAVIFAVAHLDPVHVLLVFPLGIWLGLVAWHTRSIWPAVLCHMANNLLAVAMAQNETDKVQSGPSDYILLAPCGLALVASLYIMYQQSRTIGNSDASSIG